MAKLLVSFLATKGPNECVPQEHLACKPGFKAASRTAERLGPRRPHLATAYTCFFDTRPAHSYVIAAAKPNDWPLCEPSLWPIVYLPLQMLTLQPEVLFPSWTGALVFIIQNSAQKYGSYVCHSGPPASTPGFFSPPDCC